MAEVHGLRWPSSVVLSHSEFPFVFFKDERVRFGRLCSNMRRHDGKAPKLQVRKSS
jgi:hypothetical protein